VEAMDESNSKATILSMAVLAGSAAVLLHEGLGHGVTAWARGLTVTELTSNHLSTLQNDHWVEAGGTLVNLAAGLLSLVAGQRLAKGANARYFLWLLAALNLLPAAGYFMLSGIFNFGDWAAVIGDLPHKGFVRIGMTLIGAGAYYGFMLLLAIAIRPFVRNQRDYTAIARLPYLAAGVFSCVAGAFDPLGLHLMLISTIPAAFGGSSGMLWADAFLPRTVPETVLRVGRQPVWWVLAIVLGAAFIWFLGHGIRFAP